MIPIPQIIDEVNKIIKEIKKSGLEDAVNWARVKAIDIVETKSLVHGNTSRYVEIIKVSPEARQFREALLTKWKEKFPNEPIEFRLEW